MTTKTLSPRDARMEFKTTADTKDMLIQAATLDGVDLTSFVLGAAAEKARRILKEHATISLTRQGQLALLETLSNKDEPTKAMKALMDLTDLPTRGR